MSLLRSRPKFKVICFVHDPSATAMTKRKLVIILAAFGFESNQCVPLRYVYNSCAPSAVSIGAWRRFALCGHFLVVITINSARIYCDQASLLVSWSFVGSFVTLVVISKARGVKRRDGESRPCSIEGTRWGWQTDTHTFKIRPLYDHVVKVLVAVRG